MADINRFRRHCRAYHRRAYRGILKMDTTKAIEILRAFVQGTLAYHERTLADQLSAFSFKSGLSSLGELGFVKREMEAIAFIEAALARDAAPKG